MILRHRLGNVFEDKNKIRVFCSRKNCRREIGIFDESKLNVFLYNFREAVLEHVSTVTGECESAGPDIVLVNRLVELNRSNVQSDQPSFSVEAKCDLPLSNLLDYYTSFGNNLLANEIDEMIFEPCSSNVQPNGDSDDGDQLFDNIVNDIVFGRESVDEGFFTDVKQEESSDNSVVVVDDRVWAPLWPKHV